jgi:NAD(P)H dehydrogenase (quinone)
LLTHKKALIINTTVFDQQAYETGLGAAMKTLIDDFSLSYPASRPSSMCTSMPSTGADDGTRQAYLERAYLLGKNFAVLSDDHS